jgi:DNA-binding transcriptional MerR regulator
MRLYSNSDVAEIVKQALREKGFSIEENRRSNFAATQMSGVISQRFEIRVIDGIPQ